MQLAKNQDSRNIINKIFKITSFKQIVLPVILAIITD